MRCIAFDFDGTLVDSNAIKYQAFFSTVRNWPGAETYLNDILGRPDSGTRYEVFMALAGKYRGRAMNTDALVQHWIDSYSSYCENAIAAAPEIEGTEACLNLLKQRGVQLYINSATPEPSLQVIVSRRGLSQFFDGVYGAPHSKVENLERIRRHSGRTTAELVFVGDDELDRLAAATFGCAFVAVGNGGITSLTELATRALEGADRGIL